MLKKLIIFDLDGTLIDTRPLVVKILNDLRQEKNLKILPESKISQCLSFGGISLIKSSLQVDEKDAEFWLNKFRSIYSEISTPKSLIYPNVKSAIKYLKKKKYYIAICSNKPENLIYNALSDTNLKVYFDFIIGDNKKTYPKPNPERLEKCLSFFNVTNDQAIFIGDSKVDQDASLKANINFIFFEGGYNDGVDKNLIKLSLKSYKQIETFF